MKIKKLTSLVLAAVLAATALTGCGLKPTQNVGYPDENGFAEGKMGDTMHTYFFEYTVNSAYLCDSYEGYTPSDSAKELLVAEVTVKNTHREDIEMYDTDFQVQWGDSSEDAFDYPITQALKSGETLSAEMLPDIYPLAVKESRTGLLIFEVPAGKTEFSISYMEYFDNETTGDTFFVYFDAEKK